jgi:hypothetical protein
MTDGIGELAIALIALITVVTIGVRWARRIDRGDGTRRTPPIEHRPVRRTDP